MREYLAIVQILSIHPTYIALNLFSKTSHHYIG